MQLDVQIIELEGRLTGPSGLRLLETVGECLQAEPTILLIDLELASFADSAGLAGLVRSYKLARSRGAKMFLCSPQIQVAFLLDLTFMKKTFEIFDNREVFYRNWVKQFPRDSRVPALSDFPVVRIVNP